MATATKVDPFKQDKPVLRSRGEVIQAPKNAPLPSSIEDVIAAFGGELYEIPTDWHLTEKEQLVGIKFVVFDMKFTPGIGGEKVTVYAVTEDGKRVVFNDGSTGVYAQARALADEGRFGGLFCEKGLRVSDFYFNAKTGKTSNEPADGFAPAHTYYFA